MRAFYGWVIVATGMVVSCIGLGTAPSLGVFRQPMSAAMGWSRAGISAGVGLGSSTVTPLARWIITTYDWRTAMLVIGDLAWLVIIPAAPSVA